VSARRKTPTVDDNKKAAILDRSKHGSQFGEADPTVVDGPLGGPTMEHAAPTNAAPTVMARPLPQMAQRPAAAPIQVISKKDASAPIQVISKKAAESAPIQAISMKTPGSGRPAAPENPPTPMLHRPKLRAVSEVSPAQQPQNFGNVAQPYDPKQARARALREYVIWGCLAVILASGIALVVWFVAR
jgi:hypothetical protein